MKPLLSTVFVLISLLLLSVTTKAQKPTNVAPTIAVYQFHLEHRCVSCLNIEKFTRATLNNHFPSLSLALINVEDKKNEKVAKEFEAAGTALFLYNPKTGKKANLTPSAFMNAGNQQKFEVTLKKQIEDFLKS